MFDNTTTIANMLLTTEIDMFDDAASNAAAQRINQKIGVALLKGGDEVEFTDAEKIEMIEDSITFTESMIVKLENDSDVRDLLIALHGDGIIAQAIDGHRKNIALARISLLEMTNNQFQQSLRQ